ncbi:MAG: VCBS repeat-containing protein [Chitinophagaceae bacterium]
MRNKISFIVVFLFCTCAICLSSCKELKKNKLHQDIPDESIEKGKLLAATYCQSCHLLPDPSELNAAAWEDGVLPAMGPRLGIYAYGFKRYPSYKNEKDTPHDYYPEKSVLNSLQWQNIIDYYTSMSPDSLPAQPVHEKITADQTIFKVEYAAYTYPSPAICFTKIDTLSSQHQLLLFDLAGKYLFRFNNGLQLTDSVKTDATITDIDFHNDSMLACNVNVINPNNGKYGNAHLVHADAKNRLQIDTTALFDKLQRPVQITSCDLNNDNKTDYLVCEFGHLTGALAWMENTGDGKYIHHVLRAAPGALTTYVEDVNHDGLQDVWALFSQGDESIVLFTNKGNGVFDQQQVLRFPAIYGSTSFEMADFNNDGLKDIVYTCGDNADYSMVLKPYHGVYIYINEGNNHFSQKYFFPINGCYKAMARDFDGDGDLDIATIAFFADFALQPQEGFVYLENKGNYTFKPFTVAESTKGRWLTMNAGDLDGDGKPDIVLGNFSIRPSEIKTHPDWQKGPPFIFLKNISK